MYAGAMHKGDTIHGIIGDGSERLARWQKERGVGAVSGGRIALLVVGILFLVIYLIIRESGAPRVAEGRRTPMDILKERYAKGEITGEQFQKMSEDLKK